MAKHGSFINDSDIAVKCQNSFLDATFDRKLNFISHLKTLKEKCLRSSNILNFFSRKTWGSDSVCLLRIYDALIRSRLGYSAVVYSSKRPSALKMLGPVHHLGLRLAIGAFRMSPVASQFAENNQMSLWKRRQLPGFCYVEKILACPSHPAYSCHTVFVFAPV